MSAENDLPPEVLQALFVGSFILLLVIAGFLYLLNFKRTLTHGEKHKAQQKKLRKRKRR